jgi:hypothetical protein
MNRRSSVPPVGTEERQTPARVVCRPAVTGKGGAGIAVSMEDDPQPVPAEELVGKDELDEDDEMVLAGDDLVADPADTGT